MITPHGRMHDCNVEWNRDPEGFPEGFPEGDHEGNPANMPGEALEGILRARNAFAAPTPARTRVAALAPLTTALWAG